MNVLTRTGWVFLIFLALPSPRVHSQGKLTSTATISERLRLFAPAAITADLTKLPAAESSALPEILHAARTIEQIYLYQVWDGNLSLLDSLRRDTSSDGRIRLRYFMINMGPWSVADRFRAFIAGVPPVKPARGTLYPSDMTRSEWGPWFIKIGDNGQKKAAGPLHVIRRDSSGSLMTLGYAKEYARFLGPASEHLRKAASLVTDSSTRNTLLAIEKAFGDDDYASAERAMMHSDGPLNVMIGPTASSVDGLFRYKRGFEVVVGIRNATEMERLSMLETHLPAIEADLTGKKTLAAGEKRGTTIRIDDAIYMGGGSRLASVGTAVRLPSDTGLVQGAGTMTTFLRNVHEAKFRLIQKPIAKVMLNPGQAEAVTFETFFLHMMMHELIHRFEAGGQDTAQPGGTKPPPGPLEEAGADAAALAGLQFLIDNGSLDKKIETSLYAGEISSLLRALRFGLTDDYARGAAIQFNYFMQHGAVLPDTDSRRYRVDIPKMKKAAKDLYTEISALLGDPARSGPFVERYTIVPPGLSTLRERLTGVPYDLEPTFPLAH